MQNTQFPEVQVRMETKVCCAHNVTKGCSVSSKVTVTDLATQPLRALKVLLDGLALDGVSSMWLRSLVGPPLMMHLFPFDFVYLDQNLKVIEGVELFPNVPFPKLQAAVTSAMILPLRTLAATGTEKGDQLIICAIEELGLRLAEHSEQQNLARIALTCTGSPALIDIPSVPDLRLAPPTLEHRIPIASNTVTPGAGFTVSLATTWQITSSTMAAAVLPETEDETREETAPIPPAQVAKPAQVDRSLELTSAVPNEMSVADEPAPQPCSGAELRVEPAPAPIGDELCEGTPPETIKLDESRSTAASPAQITDERIARSKEAWEKTTVKAPPARASLAAGTKKKLREPKKDPLGTRVIRWLNLEDPPPERRKIIRLLLEGIEAYGAKSDPAKRYAMRDICPTGFCLRAQEWKPGQLMSLILEKKSAKENEREHRVRVQARVVRCDKDGTGFEFVFPKGTVFEPWLRVRTKRSDETEADFIMRELRLAHALGFLRRLCPGAAEEVQHALHERLSNKRVASAVDIALLAEEALARGGKAGKTQVHSDIVMRIIEGGSWIEDNWIRNLWSGLLVSSCTADGRDTSNQPIIDLLAKLTPPHLRILSFVCGKGTEAIAAGQPAKDLYIDCSAEQLMEASDSHSFARIQQTIGHLSTYGLFVENSRPSYITLADKSKTRIAPTALGLRMWARCNGQLS